MPTEEVTAAHDEPTTDESQLDLPAETFMVGPIAGSIDVMNAREMVERLHYSTVDGLAIFEGDILLGTQEELTGPTPKGVGITNDAGGEQFRWPGGVVPYVVEAHIQEKIDRAIAHWMAHTPLRFILRTSENANQHPDYLSFEDRGRCYSWVGRQGGMQIVSFKTGSPVGSAIHEIGHALGLWHEQSRADRDQFIKIRFENINAVARHNFELHVLDATVSGGYDYESIMHYSAKAFSVNGLPTIESVDPKRHIGQRNGLSKGDVLAIKVMYPSLDWSNHAVD